MVSRRRTGYDRCFSIPSSCCSGRICIILVLAAAIHHSQAPLVRNSNNNYLLIPQSNPVTSLISGVRQPLIQEAIDPSRAKTIPGVFTASVLRSAVDSASDLATLRHAVSSSLRSKALEALTASDALSTTFANVARRAALFQSGLTRTALNAFVQHQQQPVN